MYFTAIDEGQINLCKIHEEIGFTEAGVFS